MTPTSDPDELRESLRAWLDVPDEQPTTPDHTLGAGDSVQDHYNDGHDQILVGPDYDPSVESWPLLFDVEKGRTLSLHGCGPAATSFGEGAGNRAAVKVVGSAHESYRRAPTLSGFSTVGGAAGVEIDSAPYTTLSHIYNSTEGHGVNIKEGTGNCYGVACFNVQSWNCEGHGFNLDRDAGPHGFRAYACHAIANKGIGWRVRGANVALYGGSSQLNHDHGYELRGVLAPTIHGAYIEGNGRRNKYPVELYGRGADGLSLTESYIHGINPRRTWHDHKRVQRAVNVHDSEAVSVRDNTFRRYGDAAIAAFGDGDLDVFATANLCMETALVSEDTTARLRSHGQPFPVEP